MDHHQSAVIVRVPVVVSDIGRLVGGEVVQPPCAARAAMPRTIQIVLRILRIYGFADVSEQVFEKTAK